MLKRIAAILAIAALGGACSSNDNDSASTSERISSVTKFACDGLLSDIGDISADYAEAINPYADEDVIVLTVSVGHKLVGLARTWIDDCGHLYPVSQVSSLDNTMDELEDALIATGR